MRWYPKGVATGPWTTPTSSEKITLSKAGTIWPCLNVPRLPPFLAEGHVLYFEAAAANASGKSFAFERSAFSELHKAWSLTKIWLAVADFLGANMFVNKFICTLAERVYLRTALLVRTTGRNAIAIPIMTKTKTRMLLWNIRKRFDCWMQQTISERTGAGQLKQSLRSIGSGSNWLWSSQRSADWLYYFVVDVDVDILLLFLSCSDISVYFLFP